MVRRPVRVAVTKQLERSARAAGLDVYLVPQLANTSFHRSLQQRMADGPVFRDFLEEHDIELLLDFNTEALTLIPSSHDAGKMALTTADMGIPYAALYLDPVTATMEEVHWSDHWHILENRTWIKCIPDIAHAEELMRLGVPNVVVLPMAVADDDFDTSPAPAPTSGPLAAFMGHPASSWFRSTQAFLPGALLPGLTAAAVRADMPDLLFHKVYYDLYGFAEPPSASDEPAVRARKSHDYFNHKFVYNAYLAVKQRDRFARFLRMKLGENFDLIGDHWGEHYGLTHSPRIWDRAELYERMRRVPVCINLTKGNFETALNVRHYEITACGGFMLTYEMPELGYHFIPGRECETFRSEQELLEKIGFYLDHPDKRREIAAAGQRRTLTNHLLSHRLGALVQTLGTEGALSSGALEAHHDAPQAGVAVGTSASGARENLRSTT